MNFATQNPEVERLIGGGQMPSFQRDRNDFINEKSKTLLLELAVHLKINPVMEITALLKYLECAHVGEQRRDLLTAVGSFFESGK